MIEEEIDIHPEVYGSSVTVTYTGHSDADFAKRVKDDYKTACDRVDIGDTISSLSQPNARLTVVALINNPSACTRYQGDPCIIEAVNPLHTHGASIKYSLKEIDWSSVVRATPPNKVV